MRRCPEPGRPPRGGCRSAPHREESTSPRAIRCKIRPRAVPRPSVPIPPPRSPLVASAALAAALALAAAAAPASAQVIDFEPNAFGVFPDGSVPYDAMPITDAFLPLRVRFSVDADGDFLPDPHPSRYPRLERVGAEAPVTMKHQGFFSAFGPERFDSARLDRPESLGEWFLKTRDDDGQPLLPLLVELTGPPTHRFSAEIWDIDAWVSGYERWRITAVDAAGAILDTVDSPFADNGLRDPGNPYESGAWRFTLRAPEAGPPIDRVRFESISAGSAFPLGGIDNIDLSPEAACVPPEEGLLAWWTFDELVACAGAADCVVEDRALGHDGRTGSSAGGLPAPSPVPGRIGQAFSFDGTAGIEVPGAPDLEVGPEGLTYEVWLRMPALGGGGPLIHRFDGTRAFVIWAYPQQVGVAATGGGTASQEYRALSIAPDTWTHFAVTLLPDANTGDVEIGVYLDGVRRAAFTFQGIGALGSPGPIYLGTMGLPPGFGFVGELDEFAIHDHALSPVELAAIATAADGRCRPCSEYDSTVVRGDSFDQGPAGWRVFDSQLGTLAVGWDPAGHLVASDSSGGSFAFSAPPTYLGNLSALYGVGGLSFRWSASPIDPTGTPFPRYVYARFQSGAVSLFGLVPVWDAYADRWIHWDRPFTVEAGWFFHDGTGFVGPASEEQMRAVLSNVTALTFTGECLLGPGETARLDDVRLYSCGPAVIEAGVAFCNGDGEQVPCPCGNPNDGSEGIAGCANAPGPVANPAGGATLRGFGAASLEFDTLVLRAENLPFGQTVAFLQGSGLPGAGYGVPFGDGLRCVSGVTRLEVTVAGGAASASPGTAESRTALSATAVLGEPVRYQAWYRNASVSPCGVGFNLTNGYEVTWVP